MSTLWKCLFFSQEGKCLPQDDLQTDYLLMLWHSCLSSDSLKIQTHTCKHLAQMRGSSSFFSVWVTKSYLYQKHGYFNSNWSTSWQKQAERREKYHFSKNKADNWTVAFAYFNMLALCVLTLADITSYIPFLWAPQLTVLIPKIFSSRMENGQNISPLD